MFNLSLILVILSGIIWLYLLFFRGNFWQCDQILEQPDLEQVKLNSYPHICGIIPARNEADVINTSLKSLLTQDYPGQLDLILVNDQSTDETEKIAKETAEQINSPHLLTIITGSPLVGGWSGKLWAVNQGINYAQKLPKQPDYFLFTDADIAHDRQNLTQLVNRAERKKLALVSAMVQLKCDSFWEKLLIPAFVYFFQKLYPFSWVNHQEKKIGAAAGGCILIRRDLLEKIGGIASIKNALIDDCTLAQTVKNYLKNHQTSYQGIYLGLSKKTISLRSYNSLSSIWEMVARTAYTQLNYSPLLLLGTVVAMALVYLIPPLMIPIGIVLQLRLLTFVSVLVYLLMIISYYPTIKLYNCSFIYSLMLPKIAFLYTLMTMDSALKYVQGQGGAWKGRVYNQE